MATGQRSQQRGRPIYAPTNGSQLVGVSVNAQGNELALEKEEPGRVFEGERGPGRPAGRSRARMSTGIDPRESITGTFLHRG